jgi:hypothetical protein
MRSATWIAALVPLSFALAAAADEPPASQPLSGTPAPPEAAAPLPAPAAGGRPWRVDGAAGPTFFVFFRGWALELGARPPTGHLRLSANTFAITFPDVFISEENAGFSARHVGGSVGAQYFLRRERGGLFGGAQLALQRAIYSRAEGRAAHIEVVAMPQLGYQWFPLKKRGLFITPWAGVPLPLSRPAAVVAGIEFKQEPFAFVPSLNLGWEL